jgi:D-alanyl-D-alanine dipeptidase
MTAADLASQITELHQRFSQSNFSTVADFLEAIRTEVSLRSLIYSCQIEDTGEELLKIPESMRLKSPHPYLAAGAPYGALSPWHVRVSVLDKLKSAQRALQQELPGHSLGIFDVYRPVAVQAYMINLEQNTFARKKGASSFDALSTVDQEEVKKKVYSIWAHASEDPEKPSPHSTGGAVDLTIVKPDGAELEMGSKIDEYPPKSLPSFYQSDTSSEGQEFHEYRRVLQRAMENEGFVRLPHEWWHFSYGDQQWTFQEMIRTASTSILAKYGLAS